MTQKVIFPEDLIGEENQAFQRLMALVPSGDRTDIKLIRFLVFRMRIDGEETTRAYLLKGIEHAKESGFNGALYDYLMDREAVITGALAKDSPPDVPG